MKDLLEFLNSADHDALMALTGITSAQVDQILSSRPLASLEDCARIKGVTKKRLTAWQTELDKPGDEPDAQLEPVVEEPATVEVEQQPETEVEEVKPKRKNVVGRIFGWLLVLLILAGGVYAFIKWGIPFLYEKYIKPVETNAAEITDLASLQSTEITRLNEEIAALQERLTALETRADEVDLSLESHAASLASLEDMQTMLEAQMTAQNSDLLQEISNQVTLTRAIQLLSRSRLYLSESNFGLAKDDVQTSRNLLYSLLTVLPADQIDALKIVISRLDLALGNLPVYPVVAVYDVDTAWQLLVDGLPNVPAQAVTPVILPPTEEPVQTATLDPTVEPTTAPTIEPTVEPTVEPTAAP